MSSFVICLNSVLDGLATTTNLILSEWPEKGIIENLSKQLPLLTLLHNCTSSLSTYFSFANYG